MPWDEMIKRYGSVPTCDNCGKDITRETTPEPEYSLQIGKLFCCPDCAATHYFDYMDSAPVGGD